MLLIDVSPETYTQDLIPERQSALQPPSTEVEGVRNAET